MKGQPAGAANDNCGKSLLYCTLVGGALLTGTASAAERAIEKSVVVEATLDDVWGSWTTREGIIGFFAPDARVEPRVGGAFAIYIDPLAEPGMKGADDMRFMPLGERQTRVTLHHTGWGDGGEWDKAYAYFDRAWGNVLANLQKRWKDGPVDWTDWMNQLRKWREQAAQKKQ